MSPLLLYHADRHLRRPLPNDPTVHEGSGFFKCRRNCLVAAKYLTVAAIALRTEHKTSRLLSVDCYASEIHCRFLSTSPATEHRFPTKALPKHPPVHPFTSNSLLPAIFYDLPAISSFSGVTRFSGDFPVFSGDSLFFPAKNIIYQGPPPPPAAAAGKPTKLPAIFTKNSL
ncbi:hypothetical protein L2E82_13954 [Cichorium intybus]|uniref:Uncharacterized protein n=1 Tax=Cichorium intybus TaxID=13427 RepID=A0ACB9EZ14_CICIN|nr:hypothetical protein L2E82_13954 [Cichorium intybus]